MGQGYSLASISAGPSALELIEDRDLRYERALGNARFMRCIRARRDDGVVIVKIAMKPIQNQDWDRYVKNLDHERRELANVPNALSYHRIQQTSTAGVLTRQFIHSSLYDRMSTRPFLDLVEKRWLAYQLLCAVRDAHTLNIFHGDIKTENVLVTSWNWLYLTDFSSSYKPTYLPEDNPADFSFYFDTSGRRTCYIAPERFLRPGQDSKSLGPINWSMDIFSVGCVIAELFTEGPIFNLNQILRYRTREFDPQAALDEIKDPDIREMVAHMIQLDPQARYAADEYLNFWRGKAFPEYFSSFLHGYMQHVTDPTPGRRPVLNKQENLGESDDRIERVYSDFDKIAYFLDYHQDDQQRVGSKVSVANELFPLRLDIPNHCHTISPSATRPGDNGSLLFLTLVQASLRSTARATPRLKVIELLLAFAERVPDEVKLDRILPYLMDLMSEDQTEAVRIYALRAITQLLELVKTITAQNAFVFTEYILSRLQGYVLSPKNVQSSALRATYASCLSSLARTALRFLDMMQALRVGGTVLAGDPDNNGGPWTLAALNQLHDSNKADLLNVIELHTTALLEDSDTSVRRAFLGSISALCFAFGSARAGDVVLSHLITYLNDRDWQLRCAFFETVVGVAITIGGEALEEFMLPLMVQALTDPEEAVIERVLRSFASIAELGLFNRLTLWKLVHIVASLSMHPNALIREATVHFITCASKFASSADHHGILVPLIEAYLKTLPSELTEMALLDALHRPLPRIVFDYTLNWAMKSDRGLFWKAIRKSHTFSFGNSENVLSAIAGHELAPRSLNRCPQNDEDKQWLSQLRRIGLKADDEFKLVALRDFIYRVAHRTAQEVSVTDTPDAVVSLNGLGIKPQIVIFERADETPRQKLITQVQEQRMRPIAEALRDAKDGQLQVDPPATFATASKPNMELELGSSTPRGISIPVPTGLRSPTSGPQVASSVDSRQSMGSRHGHNLQRRGSAISLLGGGKAKPETGTTTENAVGQVDGSSASHGRSRMKSPILAVHKRTHSRSSSHPRTRVPHSYQGHDPTVLRLLDSMYLDNYPIDMAEFGPIVMLRQRRGIRKPGEKSSDFAWRPDGNIVAMLAEHTGAVNRICVAPDHTFFITGSDDGTIKVWDTQRLERNTSHRSRQSHRQGSDARITALTFVEDTHCFVSTGSDGSIQVVRVEVQFRGDDPNQATRYGRLHLIRDYQLIDGEYATWCEHFREDNKSILLLSTNKCRVIALDLRSMKTVYELKNPVRHGIPLSFCVDKKRHWLLLGTTHGVLDLWDLRFRMRIKGYLFPNGSAIHRLSLVPTPRSKSRQMKVVVAGGTGSAELTIWDIEKLTCVNAYRAATSPSQSSKDANRRYQLLELDEDRAGSMLNRFAIFAPNHHATSGLPNNGGNAIRSFAASLNVRDGSSEAPRDPFYLTTGPDWRVRFWDSVRPEASCVVSGMQLDEPRPTYSVEQPSTELLVVSEVLAGAGGGAEGPGAGAGAGGSRPGIGRAATAESEETARRGRKPKSSVVSLQTQVLLKSHLDTVMDVAFLEVPYGIVVSADRAGLIYLFS